MLALPQLLSSPLASLLLTWGVVHADLGLPSCTLLGAPFTSPAQEILSLSLSLEFQNLNSVGFPLWDTAMTTHLTPL